jgi:hypothetical protein
MAFPPCVSRVALSSWISIPPTLSSTVKGAASIPAFLAPSLPRSVCTHPGATARVDLRRQADRRGQGLRSSTPLTRESDHILVLQLDLLHDVVGGHLRAAVCGVWQWKLLHRADLRCSRGDARKYWRRVLGFLQQWVHCLEEDYRSERIDSPVALHVGRITVDHLGPVLGDAWRCG